MYGTKWILKMVSSILGRPRKLAHQTYERFSLFHYSLTHSTVFHRPFGIIAGQRLRLDQFCKSLPCQQQSKLLRITCFAIGCLVYRWHKRCR